MNDRRIRIFVLLTATLLLISGAVLYFVFDKQGITKNKTNNYVNYDVSNYIDVTPVIFSNYNDVYSSINVSEISFKNIDSSVTKEFIDSQKNIIDYISGYYNQISNNGDTYLPVNTVSSIIKTQINGAVLSVFYRLDFTLDENIFHDNIKSYIITTNIDLATNKVLTKEDLLAKYSYSKEYIADKLFNEDVMIAKNQIVIDKETNISLTRSDIERMKNRYIDRIVLEFDNIIEVYIENKLLVLVYNTEELKSVFFNNGFDCDVKFRYLN